MHRLLKGLCQDYLAEGDHCPFWNFVDPLMGEDGYTVICKEQEYCTRPSDDECPAITRLQEDPPEDCLIGGDECEHLGRFDPSPPGVGLAPGTMTECRLGNGICPKQEVDDDFPSKCQGGGV